MPSFMVLILGCAASVLTQSSSKGLAAPTTVSCGSAQNTQLNKLNVSTASYLSANGLSEATAIDIAPDCAVVIAGRLQGENNFTQTRINLPGITSGAGMVLRLNSSGTQVLSVTYLGNRVDDMEINRSNGKIAVAGDFGVALLNPSANQLLWHKAVDQGSSTSKRISIGTDGKVAVLSGSRVTSFDESGTQIANWPVTSRSRWYHNDVAVDAGSQSVFVTGYFNTYLRSGQPVQVPYLKSFNYSGSQKWAKWTYSGGALTGNEADSRGYRVAMGRDGYLYFQGEAAGGNNVFRWQSGRLGTDAAPNVKFDQYNDTYNTASNHITYYARVDPDDGTLLQGQFALARLGSGRGNTIRHGNITADEKGNVYIVGQTGYSIANRNQQQIASKPVGTYVGGEGYVLVVSPNFQQRKVWTVWTGGNGSVGQNSWFWGVASGRGIAAVAGTVKAKGPLVTHAAIQPSSSPNVSSSYPAGFFSVWPGQP